jgi:CHAD domain-containing protein
MGKQPKSSTISSPTASTPVAEAACGVIDQRLAKVRDCLRKTLGKPSRRRQHIHALRVATRRATAAVDLFRDCLPKPVRTELRAVLRSLRKAVGGARDWDVLLDMLTGWALAHRAQAQSALEQAAHDCSPRDLKKLQVRVVAAVRWKQKPEPSLGSFAEPLVSQRLADLTALADRDNDAWSLLHEVRIAGKRLRYTLEVVAGHLDPALVEHVEPALVHLQEVLGGVNDSFTASRLLEDILSSMRSTTPAVANRYQHVLQKQITEHQQRMLNGREAFTAWLREWHSIEMQDALKAICQRRP